MGKSLVFKKLKLKHIIIITFLLIIVFCVLFSVAANMLIYKMIHQLTSVPGNNDSGTNLLLYISSIATPVLFFILFIILFSSILSKRIGQPMKKLIGAAKKVQNHELDFKLEYSADDEIGELFKAFEEMRIELESSLFREWKMEQDRREMVAAITHDLNTPLTVVQSSAEALINGLMDDPEKLPKYLNNISRNAQRASALLDEIRETSRMEKTEFLLHFKQVNVHGFINDLAGDYKLLAEGKQIQFHVSIHEDCAGMEDCLLDPGMLTRVIDNVINNSLRHTPSGGTVILKVKPAEEGLSFAVYDTGSGFNEKNLPFVFNKFFKGDVSRSAEKGNAGLGLYISRLIIEKHGGSIHAGNNAGKGAYVIFTVPFKHPPGD